MCVCVDLIGASLRSHVSQWVQPCSVSVVRAETDGAQLFPDAHQTPRRLQKPFPRSLLSSLHLSPAHKVPRISLDGCFAEHGCRKNAFTLPPPAPGMWASPLLLCLHSLWIERGDEKGTRVKTNLDLFGAASLYSPIFYAILAKRYCRCWNIVKMHVGVSKRHSLLVPRHKKHYSRLANALWIIRQIHWHSADYTNESCGVPLYVHKCVHSHVQSDFVWQSRTQSCERDVH